jgi:hypothetical protein
MNKHSNFWLTFGSLITIIELFIFMTMCVCVETFVFHKQYCVILFPNFLYLIFQFIVNYNSLTDGNV